MTEIGQPIKTIEIEPLKEPLPQREQPPREQPAREPEPLKQPEPQPA